MLVLAFFAMGGFGGGLGPLRWMDVLEFALRSVSAEHSERPMYFVLPAARREARAGMDWERGVSCL